MLFIGHHALFQSLLKLLLCETKFLKQEIKIFVSQTPIEKKTTALDSRGKFLGEHCFCDKLSWDMEIPLTRSISLAYSGVFSRKYAKELTPVALMDTFYQPILVKGWNRKI